MGASARAPVEVTFRETGLAGVQRSLRLVGSEGEQMGRKGGLAARQFASGLEQMARSGQLAGGSLKQVVAAGADLALMFGSGGAIAGALGIGVLAIGEFLNSTQEKIAETRKKWQEEINTLINSGDVQALTKQLGDVLSGTPAKGFTDSLEGLKRELVVINAEERRTSIFDVTRWLALRARARELTEEIKLAEIHAKQLGRAITAPAPAPPKVHVLEPMVTAVAAPRDLEKMAADVQTQMENFWSFVRPRLSNLADQSGQDAGKNWLQGFIKGLKIKGPDMPEWSAASKELAERMKAFTQGIASALHSGLTSMIENVFGGGNILAGLGSMFKQMGEVLITFSGILEGIATALKHPLSAGAATFAYGVALIALGSALGAAARGQGSRGGAAYDVNLPPIVNTSSISMGVQASGVASRVMPQAPVSVYQTIIGTSDPKAQREILGMVNDAVRRGGRFA